MTVADLSSLPFERHAKLDDVCARLSELGAEGRRVVLLAGGTDFMVEQEMRAPFGPDATERPVVLDVSRLSELRGIEIVTTAAGDVLRIGAGTTYLEMRRSELVLERAPLVARMAADVGALQIQARGTFGGNLATASPAADGVAALAAYDAIVVVRSVRGERRVPFPELQTGYKRSTRENDEVIVAVELPLPPKGTPWTWIKVGTRRAQSISKVALAALAVVEQGQVVRCGFGMASVAPVTSLLTKTRELFLSTPVARLRDEDIDKAVLSDVTPITDIRSTDAYRAHVACSVVRRFARIVGR
jgi:CO/xanthine dehydrogenase FAD-binding subunit